MSQKININKKIIDRLKMYVALQLQAYYKNDWDLYDKLEDKIKKVERELYI